MLLFRGVQRSVLTGGVERPDKEEEEEGEGGGGEVGGPCPDLGMEDRAPPCGACVGLDNLSIVQTLSWSVVIH